MNVTPQEARKKWVEALRSGEYEQGEDKLRRQENKFCCLGVACDLYIKEFPDERGWEYHPGVKAYSFQNHFFGLPEAVQKWLGLKDFVGTYGGGPLSSLAAHNDLKESFDAIAAVIEQEPPGLVR